MKRDRLVLLILVFAVVSCGIGIINAAIPNNTLRNNWLVITGVNVTGSYQIDGVPIITGAGDADLVSVNSYEYFLNSVNKTDILAHPQQSYSYLIWEDSGTYYAKNGTTGNIDYRGANARIIIQNCIASDTSILLKSADYYIDTQLLIQNIDNFNLIGENWGSKLISTGNNTLIKIGDRTNSALGSTNIQIKNIYFNGTTQTVSGTNPEASEATNYFGIQIATEVLGTTDYITVDNCYFFNISSDSIYGWDFSTTNIKNSVFNHSRGYWAAVHLHGPHNDVDNLKHPWSITGCKFYDCAKGGIRHADKIIDNLFVNVGGGVGFHVIMCGGLGGVVTDNKIVNGMSNGIYAHGSSTGQANLTISNNIINIDYLDVDSLYWHGVVIQTGDSTTLVTDTLVEGNIINGAGGIGIYLNRAQNCSILNNLIINSCMKTTAYDAIRLDTSNALPSINNVIAGNTIRSTYTTTPKYGINENTNTEDYNYIHDNKISGVNTATIRIQGANTVTRNNEGYLELSDIQMNAGNIEMYNGTAWVIIGP